MQEKDYDYYFKARQKKAALFGISSKDRVHFVCWYINMSVKETEKAGMISKFWSEPWEELILFSEEERLQEE